MNLLVSVIVPVYNVEKYLRNCINSILTQTYKNIEIIIVDDGSTDNSGIICDELEKEHSNIKVIHKKNKGLGMARNTGLEYANGDFIIFIDSDDYIKNDMCEVLVNNIIKYDLDYCKCGYYSFNNDNQILNSKKYENEQFCGKKCKNMMSRMLGSLPNTKDVIEPAVWGSIYRTEIIRKNNLLFPSERELISEDIVFNLEYITYTKKCGVIDYCGYYYRFNPKSLSKSYRVDRYDKTVILYNYLYNRLKELKYDSETFTRLKTLYFVNLKVIISQEKNSCTTISTQKRKIDFYIKNDTTIKILKEYPIKKQKPKQKIFLYMIKYKMTMLILLLVKLRVL